MQSVCPHVCACVCVRERERECANACTHAFQVLNQLTDFTKLGINVMSLEAPPTCTF